MRSILSIQDFSGAEIMRILKIIDKIIADFRATPGKISSIPSYDYKRGITTLFFEPNSGTLDLYTDASFWVLKLRKTVIREEELNFLLKEVGELSAIGKALVSNGNDDNIFVIRHKLKGAARFLAEFLCKSGYEVSVHNAGGGGNQFPVQTFTDLATIKDKLGRFNNFTFGALGDFDSIHIKSLIESFRILNKENNAGIKVKLLTPYGKSIIPEKYKDYLEIELGDSHNYNLSFLRNCDIVYITKIQEQRFTDSMELARAKVKFHVNNRVLDVWPRALVIIYPYFPWGDEISKKIYHNPRLIMLKQQEEYVFPAVLALLHTGIQERPSIKGSKAKKPKIKNREEMSISEKKEERKKKGKTEEHFKNICDGTIIDHIEEGRGSWIKKLLEKSRSLLYKGEALSDGGVIILTEGADSEKFDKKDVLVLKKMFVPKEILGLINLYSPNATFNILNENGDEKFKKWRGVELPEAIDGILDCPSPDCITNHESKAETRFRILKTGDGAVLECVYCEGKFSKEEVPPK